MTLRLVCFKTTNYVLRMSVRMAEAETCVRCIKRPLELPYKTPRCQTLGEDREVTFIDIWQEGPLLYETVSKGYFHQNN